MAIDIKNYSMIVVGSGLGGLSAAAKLSQAGHKILMVEQHNVVGGCATAFKRKRNITFEVGLHEMGSLARKSRQQMFKDMGVWDKVEFIRVPEFYRVKRGELDIVIPDDYDGAKEALYKHFPEERSAIDRYFDDLIELRTEFGRMGWKLSKKLIRGPYFLYQIRKVIKYRKTSVGEYMEDLTSNEDLKLALIANIGYYHDDPYSLSMLFFAMGQTSYMGGGGWFIKGGSQKLSDAFAEVITDNGGEILLRHHVDEIIVENGKAIGIRYHKKNEEEIKSAYATFVVANASMINVVNELIPSLEGGKIQEKINNLVVPNSLLTIYYSFSKPITDLVEKRYSTFIYSPEASDLHKFGRIERANDYSKKGFVFVDYNAIDSGLNSEGNYTASLCAIDYLKNWENLDKEEYNKKKEEVMKIYTDRLEEEFPGITENIAYMELSTPKTIQKFTLNPHGTVYGFAQIPGQALSDKSKIFSYHIKNLHFASAYVIAGGFGGSIATGYSCAMKILNIIKIRGIKC